ncbi:MAG: YdcF family protein [Candidatus Thermofonsia Clade 1 bacterium]|uniref:YdcF family protein n=1 Tax=Candidatus Thermofonsia Clade 1 bacterium TaxID=2364210 RepID=A0A2M8Q0W3_9CHLR|nr:MAG: YdcF family protein [Candidatus Thermofonsia Clade 1 bacterium]PJF43430.1 MAG: YdcF family protein [Candidatus Thermofonsia Clade 1 bacterium]RMF49346.1 MAG: YdcF family protein [Chloroflexota bacterium]
MQQRTALRRLLLLMLGAALLMPSIGAIFIYSYGQVDRAAPADAIVILGAGTRRDGTPSYSYARRIRHALALYAQGYAPRLICTGGYTQQHPKSEGAACAEMLRKHGVPESAIFYEEHSRNTEENALYTYQILAQHGWQSVLLVSDGYHLFRAEAVFRAYGLAVSSSSAQLSSGALPWQSVIRNMLRETAAFAWWQLRRWL